jgi:hypothetical protein
MCRKCQKSCCESHCDKYCHQYPFPCRTIEFSYFGLDTNRTIYEQNGIPTNVNPSSTLVANLAAITNNLYPKDAVDNTAAVIGKLYISANSAQALNNTYYGNENITFFIDSLGGSVTCALNFADDGQTSLFTPGVLQEFPIVYCSGPGLARKSGIVQLLPSSDGLAKRTIKIIFDN